MSANNSHTERKLYHSRTENSSRDSNISPTASSHSILRWQMRGTQDQYDFPFCMIWERAETVSLNRPHDFNEVRFDEDSQTLLCRKQETVVTVLCPQYEPISRSSSTNQIRCAGCHQSHSKNRCPTCGTERATNL